MKYLISENQLIGLIKEQKKNFSGWKKSKKKLTKNFQFEDFKETMKFVDKVSKIAEKQNHHPEMKITYDKVSISITDHEKGDVSDKCYKFANAVEDIKN